MKKLFLVGIAILATIAFLGASCANTATTNSSSSTPPASNNTAVSTNQVAMTNTSFSPQTITVAPGTTVTWTNNDSVAHTVTSDDGKFDSGQIANGATYQYTFNDAGTFNYHCSVHPNMTGSVIVQ